MQTIHRMISFVLDDGHTTTLPPHASGRRRRARTCPCWGCCVRASWLWRGRMGLLLHIIGEKKMVITINIRSSVMKYSKLDCCTVCTVQYRQYSTVHPSIHPVRGNNSHKTSFFSNDIPEKWAMKDKGRTYQQLRPFSVVPFHFISFPASFFSSCWGCRRPG